MYEVGCLNVINNYWLGQVTLIDKVSYCLLYRVVYFSVFRLIEMKHGCCKFRFSENSFDVSSRNLQH